MRGASFVICVAFLAVVGVSCRRAPAPVKAPIAAPASVARMRINVHNAQREKAEREEKVNLYTIFLRQAVEREFVRAGYRVVVDPNQPYDASAVVNLGDFSITSDPEDQRATASLTLKSADRTVEQVSAVVTLDDKADIDEAGPIALVDAVTRSERVADFAKHIPSDVRQPPVIATSTSE